MTERLPKHASIFRVLRNRLLRGDYESRLPGLRSLAEELRTDPKTVQCALAQLEGVGLVKRVERQGTFAVADEELARRSGRTYVSIVAPPPYIVHGDASFWVTAVLYAFYRAAEAHHLEIMLRLSKDPAHGIATVMDDAHDNHCAGTCLLSIPVRREELLQLASLGGGIVVADWDIDKGLVPCVLFDNVKAGRLAAKHLLELGHRRILGVAAASLSPSQENRWAGFQEAIREAGLPDQERIVDMNRLQSSILAHLRNENPPTAIVTSSADRADETIQLAESAGIRVPQDLSVLTYGGFLNTVRGKHITTVVMDYEEMGRRAFENLLKSDSLQPPHCERIPCSLVQGMTTGPAPMD